MELPEFKIAKGKVHAYRDLNVKNQSECRLSVIHQWLTPMRIITFCRFHPVKEWLHGIESLLIVSDCLLKAVFSGIDVSILLFDIGHFQFIKTCGDGITLVDCDVRVSLVTNWFLIWDDSLIFSDNNFLLNWIHLLILLLDWSVQLSLCPTFNFLFAFLFVLVFFKNLI